MWTTKKLITTALFGALVGAILLVISPIVLIAGVGMGSLIQPFVGGVFIVLFRRIINENGAATLIGLLLSVLTLPIAFMGPPGFFPKIIIVTIGGAIIDLVFLILKNRQKMASILGYSLAGLAMMLLSFGLFNLLGVPMAEKFVELFIPFTLIAVAEAAAAGYCGSLVYDKVKDRPFIRQLQS